MKTMVRAGITLALCAALFVPATSRAAEDAGTAADTSEVSAVPEAPTAKVLRVEGTAEIKGPSDTQFSPVSAGTILPMAGTFRVNAGAKAQLELPNGGILLLREFSLVRLDQLSKDDNSKISIPVGEFLIGFKAPVPTGKVFQVQTPAVVAGVRGTLFWGLADADMTSTFASFHDTVTLEAQGKTVELSPGTVSATKFGEAPANPAAHNIPLEYVNNFAVEGDLQGLPDILK